MKRLLVFLALLALGILALRLAIGDEGAVRANTEPTNPDVERPRPGGVQMQGKIGASVSQTGAIEFPQYKTVPQADGSIKHERVFVLKAELATRPRFYYYYGA